MGDSGDTVDEEGKTSFLTPNLADLGESAEDHSDLVKNLRELGDIVGDTGETGDGGRSCLIRNRGGDLDTIGDFGWPPWRTP